MGSSPSKPHNYSVKIEGTTKKGESAVYRSVKMPDGLATLPKSGCKTIQEVWKYRFKNSPNLPFLGQRPRKAGNPNELEERFEWETFSEVKDIAEALGSSFLNLNLCPTISQYLNYNLKFMAMYSKNSREWILTDCANSLYGIVTVPIYDTLGEDATIFMFNQTELTTCALTCTHIKGITEIVATGKTTHLKNLVILDEWNLTDEHRAQIDKAGMKAHTFNQLVADGRKNIQPQPVVQPQDISFFSYTSGTTGDPKGAMVTHGNIVATLAGIEMELAVEEKVYLSYLPLAHVMERAAYTLVMADGGKYGIFNGDIKKIKEDLSLLKPTIFISVPRLYNKFYDKIQKGLSELTGVKACLANSAVNSKKKNLEVSGTYTHGFYDKVIFGKMKAALGGRVQLMVTGSAPISTEVRRFMKIAMCCPFTEGYGQTEGCAAEFITAPEDKALGIVGGPLIQNEFKVIDVPEMNYFSTDQDAEGRDMPRGEILVRGANIIPGYYKNPEKTKETFDSEGWLHSGDIGAIMPGINALKIIDRRKNIFKLSQGEYVAPDKLEQIYKTVRGIADIFVYGDSLKSSLIGFVVVDPDEYKSIAKEIGLGESLTIEVFADSVEANDWFLKKLMETNKQQKLKGFEKIRKIKLLSKEFQTDGLVTTTFKLKRNVAKQFFQKDIDQMYVGMD